MGITRQQALDCFASDDLIGIGMEADAVRRALHPEGVVSYGLDGHVDLQQQAGEAERVSHDERLLQQVRNVLEADGTGISVNAGALANPGLDGVADLLRNMKQAFPQLQVSGFQAGEIVAAAERLHLSVRDVLLRLQEAGLQSLEGDDAGILHDEVRQRTGTPPCDAKAWVAVHRTAHQLGLRSSASMTFGAGETSDYRVEHLETLRNLQEETGGFLAFELRAFQPSAMNAGQQAIDEATSVEFLKMLAISRMVLDNVGTVRSSWWSQGLKVLQMGLRFGSNDVGSLQANGIAAASGKSTSEEELRRLIRDAGFKPVQRDLLYRTMFLP
ncbi:MAG: radical SAM protein [Janthinobacterium lividum]